MNDINNESQYGVINNGEMKKIISIMWRNNGMAKANNQ
jgi:hypothetical protein